MDRSSQQHTPPSDKDGDGVRVTAKARGTWQRSGFLALLALVVVAAGVAYLVTRPGKAPAPTVVDADAPAEEVRRAVTVSPMVDATSAARDNRPTPEEQPNELRSLDPDDVAAYFRPGDPVPTAAELIQALRDAGIHSGIAAFNPPGSSPPLPGLAVPEDFELPEGYVRHHKVTDDGEPIEPILMFSPDFEFYDADGRQIALPENLVVPPELAPPGLPLRQVEIPSP